jgi:hypothetical protein
VSWPWLVVLVLAAALLVAVEWPRLGRRFGVEARMKRERESEEFIRSVQRDLDALPTIEERDRKT